MGINSQKEDYEKYRIVSTSKRKIRVSEDEGRAVGVAFKVARIETGMSQTELAKYLMVSQDSVSSWERGKTPAPIEAIRQLGRLVAPSSRDDLYRVTGIVDESAEVLQVNVEVRKIGLFTVSEELTDLTSATNRTISLPAEWLPNEANVRAVKLLAPVSPIFGPEVIALVDVRFRDPDRLSGCVVVARTPNGMEPMALRKDGPTYFLVPLLHDGRQTVHLLQNDGDWSVMGRVIKWIGDAPAPTGK